MPVEAQQSKLILIPMLSDDAEIFVASLYPEEIEFMRDTLVSCLDDMRLHIFESIGTYSEYSSISYPDSKDQRERLFGASYDTLRVYANTLEMILFEDDEDDPQDI